MARTRFGRDRSCSEVFQVPTQITFLTLPYHDNHGFESNHTAQTRSILSTSHRFNPQTVPTIYEPHISVVATRHSPLRGKRTRCQYPTTHPHNQTTSQHQTYGRRRCRQRCVILFQPKPCFSTTTTHHTIFTCVCCASTWFRNKTPDRQ